MPNDRTADDLLARLGRGALGERLGLYLDYPVSRRCTSPHLPIWIGSVVARRG